VIFVARAQANGLISTALGDSLAIASPLIITSSQIYDMLSIIRKYLYETLEITNHDGLN
jgi:adenosylmethionine-8-amino-7-oxononanoate aminotransferase